MQGTREATMSDTLVTAPTRVRAPLPLENPTAPLRSFARVLEEARPAAPVVEVLSAVATDFRQGEASMLQLINAALAKDGMSRPELLTLRARMNRYSHEVDALG